MDHAAGRPLDHRVFEEMKPFFMQEYGNPSSSHSFGAEAKAALVESRAKIAQLIGAEKSEEIIFTSGGTESNNLAIKGFAHRNEEKGNHIITSNIEHISVINICKHLQKLGFEITSIPVNKQGMIDPQDIVEALTEETILISIMSANGEIGTIQPIREIGKIAQENQVCLHVDAVAAAGKTPIDVKEVGVDLLSLSSNDIYGPKGAGALYIKEGTRVQPIMQGGGQERGLRSGTENLPGIVGMGKASEIAQEEMETEGKRLSRLRDKLVHGVLDTIQRSHLNGHPTKRLPGNANLRFSYIEGESLILSLDTLGVQVSSGSACTSKTLEPSHVLLAIGLAHEEAHG
ncbi:aminotransferase class V-fold PLP-dependent enzyme, partial [Candidatus Bathyarchaeota archaeon]|nr:cysteine desulfurase [Desulfobacterales bacterium]NIU81343.1 aminotransferase class V-fold PLP-dependent enzyme [Candidatus Bathyarchaeota archaeon]NIV67983.1 aminotransferase class V-fold PLP-dependent enzyme [Candidatus Bathyarchaeota archaeon]NIW34526.1 aminotransferase class V-fold PLP-dependent enzyme [Candidatus Bathyarchaeota archaeon]